jgi:hypothetical protein
MSERMLTNTCDDGWNPNLLLLLRPEPEQPAVPDAVQDRRLDPVSVRHQHRRGVPEPAGYVVLHDRRSTR